MRKNLNSLTQLATHLAMASAFTLAGLGASAQALLTKAPAKFDDLVSAAKQEVAPARKHGIPPF